MSETFPDRRALKILFSTYWSPHGWKKDQSIAPADFSFAKAAGLMFDPLRMMHDEVIEKVIHLRSLLKKEQVVNHFLASLTTRRLDLRSGLGSFAIARNLPPHQWKSFGGLSSNCPVCGYRKFDEKPQDLSSNFERFKWGGVWHLAPHYMRFDLEQLAKQPDSTPTSSDWQIMRTILGTARSMASAERLSHLVKRLTDVFPSNVAERRTLIQILGYCGILVDPNRPNFFHGFTPVQERKETPWVKDDWTYPVCWWTGSMGVSQGALSYWFPFL